MSRPAPALVVLVFAVLTLIWGTTWAAIRVTLEGIPPLTGVALRFGVASILLLALMRAMGIRCTWSRQERRVWLLNATLAFAGSYGIVHWAEQYVPSGLASVLFATFPLFVAILAHHALPGDRITPARGAGIAIGFAGVAVIFSEDLTRLGGQHVGLASVVMLGSPLVSAIASVGAKRWGAGIHPFSMTAVPMGIAAVMMGVLAAVVERDRPLLLAPRPLAAILYLALFGSAITFSLYYWMLARIPATRVALLAFTIPVVAVVFGALVMHEPITGRTIAGGALVMAGVVLAVRPGRREPQHRAP
ncbi:MAG: DMT family transporter [Candidatus Polarisedimenticolia bacterium]